MTMAMTKQRWNIHSYRHTWKQTYRLRSTIAWRQFMMMIVVIIGERKRDKMSKSLKIIIFKKNCKHRHNITNMPHIFSVFSGLQCYWSKNLMLSGIILKIDDAIQVHYCMCWTNIWRQLWYCYFFCGCCKVSFRSQSNTHLFPQQHDLFLYGIWVLVCKQNCLCTQIHRNKSANRYTHWIVFFDELRFIFHE